MPQALHGNRSPAPPGAIGQRGLPALSRQAGNLAAAATRTIRAIVKNEPVFVPVAVREQRESICAGCEENLAGRCRKCGCGVRAQLLRKTHLATEQCPLDPPKWVAWPPQK